MTLTLTTIDEVKVSRPYTRARTLKRNPSWRPMTEDDIKWLWAAYQKGGLQNVFSPDLEMHEFQSGFDEILNIWNVGIVLEAKNAVGPVGVVFGMEKDHQLQITPSFFPWASPRNIVESLVKFLHDVRVDYAVFWAIKPTQKRLAESMLRYGVIRRIGRSEHWFGRNEGAMLYEGKMFNG